MAEVFLGSTVGAEGFSRKVAIKRVLPGYSDNDAFANMFVTEARISSQLVHPNIVSVLDFDRDAERRLFLVMELVEGKDLDALLQTGVLPYPVIIFVIAEVLRGLGYAHDLPVGNDVRGVVHRDVSPHNVLLSWAGAVKVSDFGIAKARAASEATASVFIKGKPAYMSPEQANGQPLDGRSDLFAVGIMLWEMLVGRRLFVGADTRSTLAAVLFGQIPRPRSLRGDVPKDIERVAMKLLERELPARYADAETAIADLLACNDAPRDGVEALSAILGERFMGEAPVRHSAAMRRASIPPGARSVPPGVHARSGADARGTTPGGGSGPASASPSLGAMMNAPTGTIEPTAAAIIPRRRSRFGKVALVLVVTVGSALATFGIVAAVKASKSGSSPTVAADGNAGAIASNEPDARPAIPATPPAEAAPAPPPPPDAPTPSPQMPPDAAPVDASTSRGKNDANVGQQVHAGTQKKPGYLNVSTDPICRVFVDGQDLGDAPLTKHQLAAGPHKVRLYSLDNGIDEVRNITILENKTTDVVKKPPK